jgi:hypothetical protein
MSVTFHPAITESDCIGFTISCFETSYGDEGDGHGSRNFETYQEAEAAYRQSLTSNDVSTQCCHISPVWSIDTESESVQMSNSNARELLEMLGYVEDDGEIAMCGSASPDDLLGRILVARALGSDIGVPGYTETTPGGATLIDAGRPAGYFSGKFSNLEKLVAQCRTLQRDISWG